MRAGKLSDLVHAANVAGLEAQARDGVKTVARRVVDNPMTPVDFVRHWKAAETSGNVAKTVMLTDLMAGQDWDFYKAVEREFAK
jgi:hypothetical protein